MSQITDRLLGYIVMSFYSFFFFTKSSPLWEELGATAGSLYILFRSGDRHISRSNKKKGGRMNSSNKSDLASL